MFTLKQLSDGNLQVIANEASIGAGIPTTRVECGAAEAVGFLVEHGYDEDLLCMILERLTAKESRGCSVIPIAEGDMHLLQDFDQKVVVWGDAELIDLQFTEGCVERSEVPENTSVAA